MLFLLGILNRVLYFIVNIVKYVYMNIEIKMSQDYVVVYTHVNHSWWLSLHLPFNFEINPTINKESNTEDNISFNLGNLGLRYPDEASSYYVLPGSRARLVILIRRCDMFQRDILIQ